MGRLRKEVLHDVSVDIGETEVPATVEIGEGFVIDSHEMEQGGVIIVNIDLIFHGIKTKIVRRPVVVTGFDSSSGEPGRKTVRIVITTVLVASSHSVKEFKGGCSAEFAPADHESIVEHSSHSEIMQKSGDGPVDRMGVASMPFFQLGVLVPEIAIAGGCVVDRDVADSGLGKATGEEEGTTEFVGVIFADPVEFPRCFRLILDVEEARSFGLHPKGQLHLVQLRIDLVRRFDLAEKAKMSFLFPELGSQIFPGECGGVFVRTAHSGAAEISGEKSRRTVWIGRSDVDVGGEIFIHRPESVDQPAPASWADLDRHAGMKNAFCGDVIIAPMVERMDETEFVDMASIHFGEQVARKGAAFPPLLPGERGGNYRTLFREGKTGRPDRVGEFLSGIFEEIRFVVVGVDLGEPALEKNVDDPLRRRTVVELPQRSPCSVKQSLPREQIRRRNRPQAEKTLSQPISSGGGACN